MGPETATLLRPIPSSIPCGIDGRNEIIAFDAVLAGFASGIMDTSIVELRPRYAGAIDKLSALDTMTVGGPCCLRGARGCESWVFYGTKRYYVAQVVFECLLADRFQRLP